MSAIVVVILLVFFSYAFAGIIAFPAFLVGLVYHFFSFMLNLVEYNLYPVGNIPYIVLGGTLIFLIVWFIIKLFTKNH